MKEEIMRFKKELKDNTELQNRLTEELKHIAEAKEAGNDTEAIAMAATRLGYAFTATDLEKANAEVQELDPEALNEAAGGTGGCFVNYDCYAAFFHDTKDEKGVACLKDYECIIVFHGDDDIYISPM